MPPEFFLDRNLGRRVAEELGALGWRVHRIGEVFPADAQDVPDEEWIVHGLAQGWVPLSKDGRIKTRDREIQPVRDGAAVQMVERLHAHQDVIHKAVGRGGPAAYAVRCDRIDRTRP
ncbi:toxin-antitoxin system, toxin component, PIN family protein [Streptomyces agglomeratus]|uniref:Toxin-antitoxin system, toxin component, PIN family protein n=1 Tax=Streptomyces agglomeratus TaxID=285458 RepID=A0A1E5P8P4_9ACTN|nr:toxin-antitoxin system, toxin component, PIN family protein [Streptomyces agglomeratus]OEJ25931.1 toxin-antitoxin system, toxin component, PIN family protein [Streptomyces agglomeratus]OEJ52563.1 toxin-antitoxin system, toxin component, PIN family protein [Streptomyces agglomeratus]